MGRIGANTIHQFQVQTQNDQHQLQPHQEYTSQVVESFDHQQAETIEEMPPPSTELFHEDLYPEESQNEPSTFASQELTMQQDSVQQQQSVLQAPPSSSKQPTSRPVTTRFSQQNGKTQRPRKQPQPQSATLRSQLQPSQHNSFPVHDPQPQAEAFPPPQSQPLPHAFPPAQDYYEPHVFPPTQEEAQAFPPTPVHAFPQPHAQSVPQAFPPAQDCYEPHEFLPNQEEKEDFPPTPIKAHAFSPPQFDPQFFPPQAEPQSFVPQNHNVQAGTNFPQPNGQFFHAANGLVQGPQGMPLVSPMPQTFMTGIPTKPLLPTESWKTGLFGCMEDPTNGKQFSISLFHALKHIQTKERSILLHK
ncbi:pollen-specific leucine-rich repeat extensin-like protein 3 [Nicotiana sylvestris]|uniref:pollen-specific leucine-rich repeat extensin-like protein 3 n=1 Tax=Nicotiana sylvestris TaxID=4096 RepID=UPI00388C41BB